jgi:hypothetical protein
MTTAQGQESAARRELRDHLARQWGAPVTLARLGSVNPTVRVPGRRSDGTVRGDHKLRRLGWNSVRWVGLLGWVLGMIVIGVLSALSSGGSPGPATPWFLRDKLRVSGPAGSPALGLLDAALAANHDLWLARADGTTALVQSSATAPPRVLWQSADPVFDTAGRTLRWPDGSLATFTFADPEDAAPAH